MERDSKGRYVKGHAGSSTKISGDNAVEYARRANKARLRNKQGRDLLRLLLSMPEKDARIIADMQAMGFSTEDITNEVVVHQRQIERAKRKADPRSYNAIMKAAGYDSIDVNLNTAEEGLVITFAKGDE